MRKTIFALVLAALVLPAAAAAKKLDVEGPLLLKGKGALRGELTMVNPSETRPVVFGGKLGAVRFVDLGGDLRVQCQGRGRSAVREDDQGHKVYTCKGKGGRARAHGSHFRVQLVARQYGARIPAGVTGTLHGDFRACTPGEDGCAAADGDRRRADRDDRAADRRQDGEKRPLPPADGPPSDEEIDELIDSISGGN